MSKKKRRASNRPRPAGGQRARSTARTDQLTAHGAGHAHGHGGGPDGGGPGSGASPADPAEAQLQFIAGLITTGRLDSHLGTLQAAISRRHHDLRRQASRHAAAQLQVGDRVILTEFIRPMYMRGATGTVTGWAQQNAIVHLDQPTGRFPGGEIRCPPLGLRRLAASA